MTERKLSIPRWVALEELERDRARVSVNKDRVRSITAKLSRLQQGIDSDKNRLKYQIENRVKEVEVKMVAQSNQLDTRFEELEAAQEQLTDAIGQERLARELLDERKAKESVNLRRIQRTLTHAATLVQGSHYVETMCGQMCASLFASFFTNSFDEKGSRR